MQLFTTITILAAVSFALLVVVIIGGVRLQAVIAKHRAKVIRLRNLIKKADTTLSEERQTHAAAIAEERKSAAAEVVAARERAAAEIKAERERATAEIQAVFEAFKTAQAREQPFTRLRGLFCNLSFVEALQLNSLGEHIGARIHAFLAEPLPDHFLPDAGGITANNGEPGNDSKGLFLFGHDLWEKMVKDPGFGPIRDELFPHGTAHIDWPTVFDHLANLPGHALDILSVSAAASLVLVAFVSKVALSKKLRRIEVGVGKLLSARSLSQVAEFQAIYLVCAEEFFGARTNKSRLLVQRQRLIRLRRELLEDLSGTIDTAPDLDSWTLFGGQNRKFSKHFDGSLKGLEIAIASMLVDYCVAFETETIGSFISVTVIQEAQQIEGMISKLQADVAKVKSEGEEVRAIKESLKTLKGIMERWQVAKLAQGPTIVVSKASTAVTVET